MAIFIPADLTIVTLRSNGHELPQRWTVAYAESILKQASDLLKSRTNIEFPRASCEQIVEEMPAGTAPGTIDETGYHYLTAAHTPGEGVRVLLVDRVARPELGGPSLRQIAACLVAYGSDPGAVSRILAHELGHLLALPHVDSSSALGPNPPAAWTRNLMYSGALHPAAELTQTQVHAARSSPLARRFGGR